MLAGAAASCDGDVSVVQGPPPEPAALIPRAELFSAAAQADGQLSPRGDRVAFLAPRDGVANLWVLSVDAMDEARALTDDRDRGVRAPVWAHDNATLLFLRDEAGDENWRLFAVDAAGGRTRALTPPGARAEILGVSASDPGGVIVALTLRERLWPDVFRIEIATGARTLMFRNSGGFFRFVVDGENKLRLGMRRLPNGDAELMARTDDGAWRLLSAIPAQDVFSSRPLAIEAGGQSFLMLDPMGRDRAALVRVQMVSGERTVLGASERADVADVWLDPATRAPEAWAADYLRREWRGLDPDASADLDFLDRQLSGDFSVVSRSADDSRWIVVEEAPTIAPRSYLYDRADRAARRLTLLFRHWPALEQAPLQPMAAVEINARDGLTLVSYLTLPAGSDPDGDGRPEAPASLVIAPHDGPFARDSYGFSPTHQWLANRGYAVMSVNFRGSTGFGAAFLNAGAGAWSGRIQDDLLDAVRWAVDNGVARADRVAIAGAGFGGLAALSGAALAAAPYRCAASYGAPAESASLGESARNAAPRPPALDADAITQPVLLAYGARDGRVTPAQSDQLAQSLRTRGVGLTYLVFPNEGRELLRQANRGAYLTVLEHFLGDCLGGRVEPVGAAFEGASLYAIDGAVNVPGLSAFARRPIARAPAAGLSQASAPAPTAPEPITRTPPE